MNSEATIEPDEDGNYQSPALQALIEVWDDYESERADQDEVLKVIQRVEAFAQDKIQAMDKEGESEEVDLHDPNRVAIYIAFQDHLVGLGKMKEAFSQQSFDLVDESFEVLQAATNQMVLGLHGLIEDEERYAPVLCIQCSEKNQKGTSYCAHCGAILPKIEQENKKQLLAVAEPDQSIEEGGETTPNYMEVAEAHESWTEQTLSDQEFYDVLVAVRERHVAQHTEVCQTLAELEGSDAAAEQLEHLDSFAAVLELNATALDTMLNALEQARPEGVEQGLDDLAEATVKLVEAEKQGEALS
jgi:hypothetical protein